MDPKLKSDTIHLTIRNRDKIIIDEEVKSITSINDTGVFDILPLHANFISIIQKYLTYTKVDGTKQKIDIDNGIIKVKENLINCYIDIIPESIKKQTTTA